ncbi:MAG: hypothetical protein KC800_15055 [Candidatus Eremiobacteraeota bacterium]|nr:hypothetical protein [Candidatus Eremiobacteraeota bacterium]
MRNRFGTSLIELILVCALLGGVGLGVGILIAKGVDFYLDSNDGIEVRKQLVIGASRLSREIADSQIDAVDVSDPTGIVFPSLRDFNGGFVYDDRGRTLWQKYVCYYVDDTVTPNRLLRKEVDIPRAASGNPHPLNPPAGPGELVTPDPLSESPVMDVAWFKGNTAIPPRVEIRNLATFEAGKNVDLVELRMAVSVSTRRENLVGINTKARPRR